jgi:hypothetical protein
MHLLKKKLFCMCLSYLLVWKSWKSDPFVFDFCFLQNIEQGKAYKVVLYVRSLGSINVSVSLTSSDGSQILASANIV